MKEHFQKHIKWYLLIILFYRIYYLVLYEWKGLSWETNWGTVMQISTLAFLFYLLHSKP